MVLSSDEFVIKEHGRLFVMSKESWCGNVFKINPQEQTNFIFRNFIQITLSKHSLFIYRFHLLPGLPSDRFQILFRKKSSIYSSSCSKMSLNRMQWRVLLFYFATQCPVSVLPTREKVFTLIERAYPLLVLYGAPLSSICIGSW